MLTEIISPKKFLSRRWEFNQFWSKEIQRNPKRRRGSDIDLEDELDQFHNSQETYEYFKERDMLMPETRSQWNKLAFQFRKNKCDRLKKKVHHEKFFSDIMGRAKKNRQNLVL